MICRFLQELERRVIIFDGSMGATIQAMDLDIQRDYLGRENCVDVLVRSRPDLIQALHESFLNQFNRLTAQQWLSESTAIKYQQDLADLTTGVPKSLGKRRTAIG